MMLAFLEDIPGITRKSSETAPLPFTLDPDSSSQLPGDFRSAMFCSRDAHGDSTEFMRSAMAYAAKLCSADRTVLERLKLRGYVLKTTRLLA